MALLLQKTTAGQTEHFDTIEALVVNLISTADSGTDSQVDYALTFNWLFLDRGTQQLEVNLSVQRLGFDKFLGKLDFHFRERRR